MILIPKEDEPTDPGNYRPISLLPLPGKRLEKLIHDRLMNYLRENEVLTPKQGGYRPNHSTTVTVASFVTDLIEASNKGQFTSAVFVDLHKAFDTINPSILLSKLWLYEVRNCAHDWFRNYLTNRQQRTMVNDKYSDYLAISHSVPQGSVLGPVLFLLYINDVVNVIKHLSRRNYKILSMGFLIGAL